MASASSAEEPGYLEGTDPAKEPAPQELDVSQDANAPASSTGGDEDAKEGSILEAVQRAAKESEQGASSDATGEEGDKSKSAEGEAKQEGEPEKDEDGKELPPFHKHPRWQEVQSELKDLRPKAQSFERLQGYMEEQGLTPQEVNQGFQIMALLKSDPAKAAEALSPYVQRAQQAAGQALPSDLQSQVDDGYISEELATEMAQLRTKAGQYEQQTTRAREEANSRLQQDVSTGISEWERSWQASDPDYSLKQPRVMERIELEIRRSGFPTSTQAAVQLANKVRQDVDQEFAKFRPTKPEKKPVSGQAAQHRTNPEPSSMREAMELAVKGS